MFAPLNFQSQSMIAKTKNKPLIDGGIILQKRQLLTVSAMLVGNFIRENLQVLVSNTTKKTKQQNTIFK